jgi:hypothetical protein
MDRDEHGFKDGVDGHEKAQKVAKNDLEFHHGGTEGEGGQKREFLNHGILGIRGKKQF